ncbi:thioredoxin domain-containing protein [Agromyces sp. MMS24-JH15]|uniref:thioredoxin domain-containing protein n=1 Tax=Agromyces sp. MMS24-JH15 TaxID=3243765 RepID=UPI0037499C1A
MANRLGDAVSPYLQAHAANPVDWYPWGEAAFAEAEARDIPVLISIGYATCHWCHVMARESFSDPAIAEILRAGFVAIKVDREEHPDVDATYLAAASAFTRQLGWPLTVLADPRGRAFYAGTYFPPRAVGGMPSFRDVLLAVEEAWRVRRSDLDGTATAVAAALAEASGFGPISALPVSEVLDRAAVELAHDEDPVHGGFGGAPKFPVAPVLAFLAERGGTHRSLAARTLLRMGASPLRDPVDGGFFRYATRADWSDPHYERMLSDNALLLDVGVSLLHAARAAGDEDAPRLEALVRELVRFLLETMRLPSGGFASAQDSESVIDGVRDEGGYYHREAAERAGLVPPALDEKVLTGWNGLAIGALACAGISLGDEAVVEAAQETADWLLANHVRDDGRLVRASRDGVASTSVAALEDSGMFAGGLLEVAIATGEVRYAVAARRLVDRALAAAGVGGGSPDGPGAGASSRGGPVFAAPDGVDPVLGARGLGLPADPAEGAAPSGITATAEAARRLHALGAGDRYLDAATRAMEQVAAAALARPIAFGGSLALMSALDRPLIQLVTVVPDPAAEPGQVTGADRRRRRDRARDDRRPRIAEELAAETRRQAASVSVVLTDAQASAFAAAGFELFEGRGSGPAGRAYRCERFVCALPVDDAEALRLLGAS